MGGKDKKIYYWVSYNTRYAYVYGSIEVVSEANDNIFERYAFISQKESSFKNMALTMFFFNGKKVRVNGYMFETDADEYDMIMIRIAEKVPASKSGLWRKIIHMIREGKSKKEIIDEIIAELMVKGDVSV